MEVTILKTRLDFQSHLQGQIQGHHKTAKEKYLSRYHAVPELLTHPVHDRSTYKENINPPGHGF